MQTITAIVIYSWLISWKQAEYNNYINSQPTRSLSSISNPNSFISCGFFSNALIMIFSPTDRSDRHLSRSRSWRRSPSFRLKSRHKLLKCTLHYTILLVVKLFIEWNVCWKSGLISPDGSIWIMTSTYLSNASGRLTTDDFLLDNMREFLRDGGLVSRCTLRPATLHTYSTL